MEKQKKKVESVEKPVLVGKTLTISLFNHTHEPKFTFDGDWCGKDVRVVLRHISQAYRRNQIARAKAMAKSQELPLEGAVL